MTTNHVVITTEPFVVDIPSDGEIVEVCQRPARLDGSEGCWMPQRRRFGPWNRLLYSEFHVSTRNSPK